MQLSLAAVFLVASTGRALAAGNDPVFEQSIKPLLNEYCFKCHSTEKHKGDLDLQKVSSRASIRKHPKIWQAVAEQLASNEMPPAKENAQLSAADREKLVIWVRRTLDEIAMAHAGDPGPVVLRRLSNAEYTYTVRDLTGVESLDPAREFPVDGAAGEGFTNTGQSLVMSSSLFAKYLDAGKAIADHAVLLPDGIRFSPSTTRRDRTEDLLSQIRQFYRRFTAPRAPTKDAVDGVVFSTDGGGAIPLVKYLEAALKERRALESGGKSFAYVAREHGLQAQYLETLFRTLSAQKPSLVLDGVRARWRSARSEDAAAIAGQIGEWQKALWKFSNVGHIGKVNGPKAWMEAVSPLAEKQEVTFKLPESPDGKDVTLYLVATDAGDGNHSDVVEWREPRLVAPGRSDVLLRDLRELLLEQTAHRSRIVTTAEKSLAAVAEAGNVLGNVDIAQLASNHGVDADVLQAWAKYLGVGVSAPTKIEGHLSAAIPSVAKYAFVKGWGTLDTPSIVANSSGKHVRIPGNLKPHSVAVHPSPRLRAAVGWQSPVAATAAIEATIARAHPECGNGVVWSLELRRGNDRQRLATGTITDSKEKHVGPIKNVPVRLGDLIALVIDPRDGNNGCDLVAVELAVTREGDTPGRWSLTDDTSSDITAGNPHADRLGNKNVWHFFSEPVGTTGTIAALVPPGSLLARWQAATNAQEKSKLAGDVRHLLATGAPARKDHPDAVLYRQLTSLGGPLTVRMRGAEARAPADTRGLALGLDPALFGRHPNGQLRDAKSLYVRAPALLEVRIPAELAAGREFVVTAGLDKESAEGSVQVQVLTTRPAGATTATATGILVNGATRVRQRIEAEFEEFRQVFPAALCYSKIVPVDEAVTLTLFHREDHQLSRLMLSAGEKTTLDRLWAELHYISQDALALVDAFDQIWQYSTQDGDPKSLEPLREPIKKGAADFQKLLVVTQPQHIDAVLEFADRAYRRPLRDEEKRQLRSFYRQSRGQNLSHDQAIRLTLARILVAPAFLYRAEKPVRGKQPGPVNEFELANRLSYFLWSSMPDQDLRAAAAAGTLRNPDVLAAQTQRMLRDPRMRRMATEFGCSWLHIHGFDQLGEKSDRHFPTFLALRGAMYEETIRFFTDFFQNDRTVLNILDADYTFLNEELAKHYGIPGVTGSDWRRVHGIKKYWRGGILGQATTLTKQSGASRTSPILRGNWVAETLLGDKLPRPPKDVPPLPEDQASDKLTMRQLTEKHTSDARCAGCHVRIDAYGFSLEAFDAIGRLRQKDVGDQPVDSHVKTMDGTQFQGIAGLREYLLSTKRDAFVRQFSRKLVGYSLGRAVQLSDESLLQDLQSQLSTNDYRIGGAIQQIVRSAQFRNIRAINAEVDDEIFARAEP